MLTGRRESGGEARGDSKTRHHNEALNPNGEGDDHYHDTILSLLSSVLHGETQSFQNI